jgi:hypothetical protein
VRIGITGSWKEKDREHWDLRSDLNSFKNACYQLGLVIAKTGAEITVGSDSEFTADKHVVEGYLSKYSKGLSVRVVRPKRGQLAFAELRKKYSSAFVYVPGLSSSWRHTRQKFVADIDVLITVGGADGTYQAALELSLTRKRLVPIGAFGGASSRLLAELLSSGTLRDVGAFEKLANPWRSNLASHVVSVVGADRPSKILLIHGHAKDRIELKKWLEDQKLARPVIMGQQFTAGQTLPEKFEDLASQADAAIALATPDDLASTVSRVVLGSTGSQSRVASGAR